LSSKWRETHPERLYTSHGLDAPYWSARRGNLAADLGEHYGGVMRIIPGIIIPAILALGVAGAILSGAEMTVAAAHAPGAHAHVVAMSSIPLSKYHNWADWRTADAGTAPSNPGGAARVLIMGADPSLR